VIVPLVYEEEWRTTLTDLPPFETTARHIVLLSPHPDDETLAAGGFLAAQRASGAEIDIVAVTDGENAYSDFPDLARVRRKEQEAALARLNIDCKKIHRLGLVDSGVEQQKHKLVEFLLPLVTAQTLVLAPWTGDFHPDHEACGWAAQQVAQQTGASLFWYFFWTWHRGTPAHLAALSLHAFPLDAGLLLAKLDALRCHESQIHRASGEPILPEYLLAPARRTFEVFAPA
jgi:LmbE family N-acetylglucosaminyl deacetylase